MKHTKACLRSSFFFQLDILVLYVYVNDSLLAFHFADDPGWLGVLRRRRLRQRAAGRLHQGQRLHAVDSQQAGTVDSSLCGVRTGGGEKVILFFDKTNNIV